MAAHRAVAVSRPVPTGTSDDTVTSPIPTSPLPTSRPERRPLPPPARNAVGGAPWLLPFPRLPQVLGGVAVILVLLSLGLPNIAPGVPFMAAEGSPVRMFFGVSEEMNLPTFFSVLVAVAAGALQLLVGRMAGGAVGRAFLVTGTLVLLMGFDDFAALHERLRVVGALFAGGSLAYTWIIPGAVLGLVVLLAFALLVRRLRGRARLCLMLGMGLVMVAALGFEGVSGLLDRPGTDGVPLQLMTHLEEFTEMIGLILVLHGTQLVLRVRRGDGFAVRLDGAALGRR